MGKRIDNRRLQRDWPSQLPCNQSYFGKMLNQMSTYGCDRGWRHLPPGVSAQAVMCKIKYYGAQWAHGDALVRGGHTWVHTSGFAPHEYTTSMVGNKSLSFVRDVVEQRRGRGGGRTPFFVWAGPHAPHLPSTPA